MSKGCLNSIAKQSYRQTTSAQRAGGACDQPLNDSMRVIHMRACCASSFRADEKMVQTSSSNESQEVASSSSTRIPVVSLNLMIALLSSSVSHGSDATMHKRHLSYMETYDLK
ncbi:unnamed protein product [Dovyalis caffra]|uniref:Uncharacterized protein n=1 Tax=Dovyalis caffra TaxID=77055 RepID=A0AAV1RFZ7_9ROSI|nr:unnamed protein product [Dovyalis caffra]